MISLLDWCIIPCFQGWYVYPGGTVRGRSLLKMSSHERFSFFQFNISNCFFAITCPATTVCVCVLMYIHEFKIMYVHADIANWSNGSSPSGVSIAIIAYFDILAYFERTSDLILRIDNGLVYPWLRRETPLLQKPVGICQNKKAGAVYIKTSFLLMSFHWQDYSQESSLLADWCCDMADISLLATNHHHKDVWCWCTLVSREITSEHRYQFTNIIQPMSNIFLNHIHHWII